MTIGEKIRATRKEKGMTQKQLADICKMADSAIRKYESGQVKPKTEMIKRIASALDVPATHLMDRGLQVELEAEGINQMLRRAKEKYNDAENRGAGADELNAITQIIATAEEMLGELSVKQGKTETVKRQVQAAMVQAETIQQAGIPSESEQEERTRNVQELLQLYGELTLTGQQEVLNRIKELMFVPGFRK